MRILLIEDDKGMSMTICRILRRHYVVDISYTGKAGLYKSYTRDYDLIIIDYILPDITGLDVCKEIRNQGSKTPILFLTAHYRIRDKVAAFDSGADDYVLKPFSTHELLARVRALMRRYVGHYREDILMIDALVVDSIHRTVTREKKRIKLRKKAFDLLEYLMRNRDRVLSRDTIMEHVWESTGDEMSNTVDVHIKYLRDKVDKPFKSPLIKTVHGFGYKISYDES